MMRVFALAAMCLAAPLAAQAQTAEEPTAQTDGDAALAEGNLFVGTSQALSNAAHNATNNQQQSYVTMQASTTQGVATLYSVDTASDAVGTAAIEAQEGAGEAP